MEDKPRRRKKTSTTPKMSAIPLEDNINIINDDLKKLQLARELNTEQINTLVNIEAYLCEFLDDFVIIGHAINGARVNITHAPTAKDQDSLEQYYTDNLLAWKNKKLKGFD